MGDLVFFFFLMADTDVQTPTDLLLDMPKVGTKRKQVRSACVNCRKSKAGCSNQRPCSRCTSLGLSSTCVDIPRKKRERKKDKLQFFMFNQPQQPHTKIDDSKIEQSKNSYQFSPLPETPAIPIFSNSSPPKQNGAVNHNHIQNRIEYAQHNPGQWSSSDFTQIPTTFPARPNTFQEDQEKDSLRREIEKLRQEKQEQQRTIEHLKANIRNQRYFTAFAISHWKFAEYGKCILLSYSNSFLELTGLSDQLVKSPTFRCSDLYPHYLSSKVIRIIDLIYSGQIQSFVYRAHIAHPKGDISVFCACRVQYCNNTPTYIYVCMQDYDPRSSSNGDLPFFEPVLVKLNSPVLVA